MSPYQLVRVFEDWLSQPLTSQLWSGGSFERYETRLVNQNRLRSNQHSGNIVGSSRECNQTTYSSVIQSYVSVFTAHFRNHMIRVIFNQKSIVACNLLRKLRSRLFVETSVCFPVLRACVRGEWCKLNVLKIWQEVSCYAISWCILLSIIECSQSLICQLLGNSSNRGE